MTESLSDSFESLIVGSGWAGLGLAANAFLKNEKIAWVVSPTPRMLPPHWGIQPGEGQKRWEHLLKAYDLLSSSLSPTVLPFLEYRSHRWISWEKACVDKESFLKEEGFLAEPGFWTLPKPFLEFEEALRKKIHQLSKEPASLLSIHTQEGVGTFSYENSFWTLHFSSGTCLKAKKIYYTDSLASLRRWLSEFSLPASWISSLSPTPLLQIILSHQEPLLLPEGTLSVVLPRDPGESSQRRLLGYTCPSSRRSVWSTRLTEEEAERPPETMKRLKKIRSTFAKIFPPSALSPPPQEHLYFILEGMAPETSRQFSSQIPGLKNFYWLTDCQGPSKALEGIKD